MKISQKTEMKLPYDAAIPIPGYLPKKYKNSSSKENMHSYVYKSTPYNSHHMETT